MKTKMYDDIIGAMNKAGIKWTNSKYVYTNDKICIERFLLAFLAFNYPLGFDLFDGTCSGSASITFGEDNLLTLVATDCGTERFTFAIKSIFIILGDRNDDVCPTIVFESDDIGCDRFTLSKNVRKEKRHDNYDYIKVLKSKGYNAFSPIYDIDEVDEMLNKLYFSDEDVLDFFAEEIFLTRKIFCCLNIQSNRKLRHPFSFSRFLLKFKNSSPEEVDVLFKEYFK